MILIRHERPGDEEAIREVNESAFETNDVSKTGYLKVNRQEVLKCQEIFLAGTKRNSFPLYRSYWPFAFPALSLLPGSG